MRPPELVGLGCSIQLMVGVGTTLNMDGIEDGDKKLLLKQRAQFVGHGAVSNRV